MPTNFSLVVWKCFEILCGLFYYSSAKQDGENADDHKVFDLVFYFINTPLTFSTLM